MPVVNGLPERETSNGKIALRETHKLGSCQSTTEWEDETDDMRIKAILPEAQPERSI